MRSSVLRALRFALVLSAGGTVFACAPLAHAETVLYDRGDQVQRLLTIGPPGLTAADGLIQQQPAKRALPGTRQAWKVSGGAGTRATPSIVGLGATKITAMLKSRIARSGGHLVFLDELGPAFKGRQGEDLGQALRFLQKETTSYAPDGLNLRVHLYVPSPGPLLADDKEWIGARRAMSLAGGVWLEAYHAREQWTAEEWLTWPGFVAGEMDSIGGESKRVHVLLRGGGDHAQTWRLARTGSACAVLGTGPGAYRLGEDAARFVAEFRRTFPSASPGPGPVGCTPAAPLPAAAARAVVAAVAREESGIELPSGAIATPPLPAGSAAQVTVRLGDDPLGLAAGLGIGPERMWTAARARLRAVGTGFSVVAPVEADGTARIEFLPTAPGPVSLTLVMPGSALGRAVGAPVNTLAALQAAGAPAELVKRVLAAPATWTIDAALIPAGAPPGTPPLVIVPPV
jgi:hypothetical protein